jgi:hypothetical protein
VAHATSRGWEDPGLKPAQANTLQDLSQKYLTQKGLVEWLQVYIGPEIKPQYHNNNNKKRFFLYVFTGCCVIFQYKYTCIIFKLG